MKKILFVALSGTALALMACGDDVTEVYEDSEVTFLESEKSISKQTCDASTQGELLFVSESSTTYVCDGKNWISLKGKNGDNGSSCTAEKITKDKRTGYVLTCGKDVVDTLWNGKDGNNGVSCSAKKVTKDNREGVVVTCGKDVVDTLWNGKNGNNGVSCSAKKVTKGNRKGVAVTCGKDVVDTLWNGEDGVGCKAEKFMTEDERSGIAITCGEGETDTLWNSLDKFTGNKEDNGNKEDDGNKDDNGNNDDENLLSCGDNKYDPETQFCDTRDNHVYKFVVLGTGFSNETWMAENLNYADSAKTPELKGGTMCYKHEKRYCDVYGRLYSWKAAQAACPEGWHLPDISVWTKMVEIFGEEALSKLKSDATEPSDAVWANPGTNESGFSALPAGGYFYYEGNGSSMWQGFEANFWTSSQENDSMGKYCSIVDNSALGNEITCSGSLDKNDEFSVRCIKNQEQ